MREWLHDDDEPEDIPSLVDKVAKKRQVPYKQRILDLAEMREEGDFENPSPETVRFALDTMERFIKEFK